MTTQPPQVTTGANLHMTNVAPHTMTLTGYEQAFYGVNRASPGHANPANSQSTNSWIKREHFKMDSNLQSDLVLDSKRTSESLAGDDEIMMSSSLF